MRTFRSLFIALGLSLTAAAVTATSLAPEAAAQGKRGGGDYYGATVPKNVFFSPSGEPFRSALSDPYPSVVWFAQADTDHDGKISRDEFINDAVRFFGLLDVNHDGYISSLENTRYEQTIAPEILDIDPRIKQPAMLKDDDSDASSSLGPNGGKYYKQILGASQYSMIDEPQPVRAADTNFDFRISMDEWLNATNQRFAILDRNDDGFITPNEMPLTPAQQINEKPKGKDKAPDGKKHFGMW